MRFGRVAGQSFRHGDPLTTTPEAIPAGAIPSEAIPSEAIPAGAIPAEAIPAGRKCTFCG